MMSMFRPSRAARRSRTRFVPTALGLEERIALSATTPHTSPHHVAKTHHAKTHHAKGHHAEAPTQTAATTTITPTIQAGTATQTIAASPTTTTTQASVSTVPSLNQQVVAYLNRQIGQRIGSGECTALAIEALRVAGAKFSNIAPDNPTPGDYVWGSLVKTETSAGGQVIDSAPTSAIQPGDVLQFSNATFSNGVTASHHTAVVAAVDSGGRVTQIYQQNVTSATGVANRTDTLSPLDLTQLTSGSVTVYQPIARVATPNTATFTVTNNAATSETIALYGTVVTLTGVNTPGSMITFTASGLPQLALNGLSYLASDGGGYQIVGSGSTAVLQAVN